MMSGEMCVRVGETRSYPGRQLSSGRIGTGQQLLCCHETGVLKSPKVWLRNIRVPSGACLNAQGCALNRPKILIVEDDADTRRALNLRLRFNDFDTVYAVDGFSAVSAAAKEHPDVILLDIGLPAGDGFMVMERLKASAALATIPVIVLTGRERKANFERAMQSGCYAYFEKPADNEALLTAIRNAIGVSVPANSAENRIG